MKRFAEKMSSIGFAILLAAVGAMLPGPFAQAQDPSKVASIHGHVQNAAGLPVKDATVRLTTDHFTDAKQAKWNYTFPVDENGDYKGTGIAPETYLVVVYAQDTVIDYFRDQTFKAGEDKAVAFDMTRKDFIDKMTPEQKQALEAYKKSVAEAQKNNSQVQNLNATLKQAREDTKAGNFDAAAKAMTDATTTTPDQPILWIALGDAQLGQADAALKAAKAAGKTATDPDVQQKYGAAAASYKKAIDLNGTSKKPNPDATAAAYNQMGQAYAQSGDIPKATDAYDQAAKSQPTKAATYYLNEAIVLYKASKIDDAAAAADKAIAADATKADAYYIKGQALVQKATVDEKTQKVTVPPGCVDAYQHYLAIAPDGAHATEVKEVLTGIGEKVESNYKAQKKK